MLTAVLAVLVLCPALSVAGVPVNNLAHSTILDVDNKYHISWDFDDQNITFEVSVETRGYIGLGFSPNGDMAGSDIVIAWVDDSTGMAYISDRHAVSRSEPLVDDNQDYSLLNGYQNETHTVIKFTRKLELCSNEDHLITDETIRLIWAYHDADPGEGGSIQYHITNRGNKNMFLLNPQRSRPKIPDNVIHMDFLNQQFAVPTTSTTYWCQSFPVPSLDRKHHIINAVPIIQSGHESEVHHIILYACYEPVSNDSIYEGHECYHANMPTDFWKCDAVMLAWAIGGEGLYLPENVGFPLGYEGDPTMFLLETHYDNPTGKAGLIDSSGLRLTLTPDLREYDAGILETGELVRQTQVIPPHFDRLTTAGICFPECLSQAMKSQPQGIKLFANNLHTHLLGIAVRVRHFRHGVEQPLIGEDRHYDFNYQYTRIMEKEIEILPGDHIVVECSYNSTGLTGVTFGGLTTQHEMCIDFLMYYPKMDLSLCGSSPTTQFLASFMGVTVDGKGNILSPPELAGPGKNLTSSLGTLVDWKDKSVQENYQKWISQEDVEGFSVGCKFGTSKYPMHGNVKSSPTKVSTLPPETCGGVREEPTTSGGFRADLTGLLVVASVVVSRFFRGNRSD